MPTAALLRRRDQIPSLLTSFGLTGTGVELGVQRGLYSEVILGGSRLSRLLLVNPWAEAGDDYPDVANVSQAAHDQALAEARSRLARFGDRAEFWRMTSLEAVRQVEDESLDFIYVDARHHYASVLEDLGAWYPKMVSGGVMAGHDYLNEHGFGVRAAVDEFFSVRNAVVYETLAEPDWPTWIASMRPAHPSLVRAARLTLGFVPRAQRKVRHVRQTRRWA